jgi:hypothetical protein
MTEIIINEILKKNKPVIYFHKDEKYFPCNADFFVKNSNLIKDNKILDTDITQTKLYNYSGNYTEYELNEMFIQPINENVKYGYRYNYNDCPLYYYVKETNEKIYIYFFLFYGYNGSYNILNIDEVGQHYNDVEHFTYEIDIKTQKLERIFFSSHGKNEGIWKNINDVEIDKIEKERPVLYVSKNGHGFYPKTGSIFRIFGLANDLTNKGYRYDKYNYINILNKDDKKFNPEEYGWFYSKIKFGIDGTKDIYIREYLQKEEEGTKFQLVIPEYIYDIVPIIVVLLLLFIIINVLEIYLSYKSGTKRFVYLVFMYTIFVVILKLTKQMIESF